MRHLGGIPARLAIETDHPDRLVLQENRLLLLLISGLSGGFALLLISMGRSVRGEDAIGWQVRLVTFLGLVFAVGSVLTLFYRKSVCVDQQQQRIEIHERKRIRWTQTVIPFQSINNIRLQYGPRALNPMVYTWALWIEQFHVTDPLLIDLSSNRKYMHRLADAFERIIGHIVQRDRDEQGVPSPSGS